MSNILPIKPEEIEAKSFAIIEEEFHSQTGRKIGDFPSDQFAVIQRVIHATGDFSFSETLSFHPSAVERAVSALQNGKNIITDVNMVASGINKKSVAQWGGKVICRIADPEIAELAAMNEMTRSETAIMEALAASPGIAAIGNAPTALLKILEACKVNPVLTPDLIIGVPVGFVNAAESKDILAKQSIPFITNLGRKGGSPVAAAITNALIKIAKARS